LVLLGFALAGLIGSIVTAWLLLPNLSEGLSLGVSQIEDASRATHKPPAVAQVESDGTPVAPDFADDKDASPNEEKKRPEVSTDAGLAIEQMPAELSASDASAPDIGVSGTGAIGVDSSGDPASQLPAAQQTSEEQTLIHRADSGLTSEEKETPPADEKIATPDSGDSATATHFQVDPVKSDVQSAGGDAQRDPRSEPRVDKLASSEQTVDKVASDCAPLFPIKFKFGSVTPQVTDMEQKIERLAVWLNANPAATLSLDGHADASGPEEYNLLLSYRRAAAVASLLEHAGTSRAQLVVRAHGEGQSSLRSADAALERRVALTIDAGEPCDEPSHKGEALR
jgi:outer membrane protein OmpA-like peptidoglycan-associated protein